jgi:UDP-galactopyranose mutase
MNVDCIVVGSHLRFDGVWQRPQQLLTRLAARVPVLFVEEPFLASDDRDDLRTQGNVTVLRPLRAKHAAVADAETVASTRAWIGRRRALVWLYTPMMLALADAAPGASIVYDCMDELAAFDFAPPELRAREADLLARALGARVHLFASGVEFDHFASARTIAPHPLLSNLPHPICGYIGVVDERIDIALLETLARRACSIVLIGPIVKIDPAILPQRTNVHYTGQVDYADLPAMLAGFDVAAMPFARNAATANISPTKTPEYLAAGVPVVSTRIADVVASYGDVVTIAVDAESFANAVMAATETPPERIAAGVGRARDASWDAIVDRMWATLEGE